MASSVRKVYSGCSAISRATSSSAVAKKKLSLNGNTLEMCADKVKGSKSPGGHGVNFDLTQAAAYGKCVSMASEAKDIKKYDCQHEFYSLYNCIQNQKKT